MKRLLVVAADYYPVENANTGIIYRLLQQLKNQYEITVATINTMRMEDEEEKDGIRIVRLPYHTLRKGLGSEKNNFSDSFIIAEKKIEGEFRRWDLDLKDVYFFLKGIRKRLDLSSYDLLLSFSGPFISHYCASKIASEYHLPWTAYYFDPFFSNATLDPTTIEKRKKLEEQTLSGAKKALLMFPTDRDYLERGVAFSSIIRRMQIPGIRGCDLKEEVESRETSEHHANGGIHCYFFGNLYRGIREPVQTLRMFSCCDDSVKLFLVGGCDHGDLSQYTVFIPEEKKKSIAFLGRKRREDVRKLYHRADVLVNIGNRCTNQMPSKLYEYIYTGKPIVNIYVSENCPSLDCLQDYSLVFNISEREIRESPEKTADELMKFLRNARGKRVSYQEILEKYSENMDEAVAGKLAAELEM